MGLLVCFCCGKQKEVKPIKKGAKYICSNCGAKEILIIRSPLYARFVAWKDKDGCDAEKAFHKLYAGLESFRQRHNYAKGWTAHKFRKITGRWPNGEAVESAAPAAHGLLQWLRKQNAAYARGLRLAGVVDRVPVRVANVSGWGPDNVDATSPLMTEDDWGVKL